MRETFCCETPLSSRPEIVGLHQRCGMWNLHHPGNACVFYLSLKRAARPEPRPTFFFFFSFRIPGHGRNTFTIRPLATSPHFTCSFSLGFPSASWVSLPLSASVFVQTSFLLLLLLQVCEEIPGKAFAPCASAGREGGGEGDQLSYANNVSAPRWAQTVPHIWQIT